MYYRDRRHNPVDPRKDTSWLPQASTGPRVAFVRPPPPPKPTAHIGGEEMQDGADYAGRDLRGLVFDNAHSFDPSTASGEYDDGIRGNRQAIILRNCSFDGADLQGVAISGVIFVECLFAGADFRQARLTNVRFEGCDLAEADFRDAIFDGVAEFAFYETEDGEESPCDLDGAMFCNAKIKSIVEIGVDTSAIGADFLGCVLSGTLTAYADLTNAVFDEMCLEYGGMLDLSGAIVRNASARNIATADGTETRFPPYERKEDFEGLDLEGTVVGADEGVGLSDAIRFAHWYDRDLPNYGYEDGLVFGQPHWRATRYRAVASDGTVVYDGRNKNEMKTDLRRYFEGANPKPVKVVEDGYRDATEEEYDRDEEPYIRERRERTVRR